jgi:MOSC domain-containing protein YiiM
VNVPGPSVEPSQGTVVRLGRKPRVPGERGLPKPEVLEARLTADGLEGDYNLYRQTRKAGDPEMALLLMPLETLEELGREGWPVRPGDLGENVTTSGLTYASLRPPCRLRLGGAVVETSRPCEPCDNLFALPYVGAVRGPTFLKTMLGRRGWFARVIEEGTVRKGDAIRTVVEEPEEP